ncbi:C40 family peptidase [Bacillus sp. T33-2]|uniref:C40 family peptidase n=1 Tax=Bacillus sp. T33-2 TaxID=2054168 RepID=UPI000C76EA1E|nr:C40 family peptidase [Bacillus sp. T33-2]PLR94130.1 peptidoglycan endopeptidase [Bacillus sp. T33-2]
MKKQILTVAATAGFLFTSFNGAASAAVHTVKSGDTLWGLSRTYNVTVNDLKAWNHLSGPTIYVNQKLTVDAPAGTTPAQAATATTTTTYTVKSGDTLWGISRQFGVSVGQLKSSNGLSSDLIRIGQTLRVTGQAPAVAPVAAPVNTAVASASTSASALINEAKKYMGVPYAWGGSSRSGFDCSGYLQYVFNKVGISIPRTVATIWNATTPVPSPRAGDIVFFETYKAGPSHAGIYLGSNKFIHASSSYGVTISDMTTSYWKARYLGAKTKF